MLDEWAVEILFRNDCGDQRPFFADVSRTSADCLSLELRNTVTVPRGCQLFGTILLFQNQYNVF